MKKLYESPELEIVNFKLADVLTVSKDEIPSSGGFINDPESDMEELEEP